MSLQLTRVAITTKVTHTKVFYVGSQPTDMDGDGPVNVTITRFDGTAVQGPSAATKISTGTYTFAPDAVDEVDAHLMVWSGTLAGAVVAMSDVIDYCGGFLCDLASTRLEQSIAAAVSDVTLAGKRTEAEMECEGICRRAFVPRFAWETVFGTGLSRLHVRFGDLRAVRAVTVAGTPWSAEAVAALVYGPGNVIRRPGGALWPQDAKIRVEYEHGLDYPPPELGPAVGARIKYKLGRPKGALPDRAVSWTTTEGGTYQLSTPSGERTGDPFVDPIYARNGRVKGRSVIA